MPDQASARGHPQENALYDYIDRLDKRRDGRFAVHVRLSHLSRMHTRVHYFDLARDTFAAAIRALEGQLYVLKNHDLVFLGTSDAIPVVSRAVERLRALFSEDPLFTHKDSDPQSFCNWYRLENDYEKLRLGAREWLREAEFASTDYARKEPGEGLAPIQPELLTRVERILDTTDITNLARRQTVCTVMKDQPAQPLFEEIYVSIFDLQAMLTPGVNWLSNPWLFQYLTHTLDRRMMAMLVKNGPPPQRAFSLNLNVASVLSAEFRRFDEVVAPQMHGRPVIEFSKVDVFSDIGAFFFARDYLHERGYRVCLDGLTHLTMPYCNRAQLGFDLIKIYWRPDGIEDMDPEMIPAVREIVMHAGQARTILCRCENPAALDIGQQLGIVMFQGRHIDRLLGSAEKTGVR
ncbi:MAG: hypothetical protein AB7H77_08495 [Bdellovibrionales bacterium]